MTQPIRIAEWATGVSTPGVSRKTRHEIQHAARMWQQQNRLRALPLFFTGPDGNQLCTRQYVGVVEVDDVLIEIYPKLDAALIDAKENNPLPASAKVDSVMRNLLWMLEVADYRNLAEAQTAQLEEAPTSFFDLFAFLLGKNLLPELARGLAHKYLTLEDDLRAVRGRIHLVDQVTRNWNRFDRVLCVWDEFTPDTAMNRLFKCACRFLSQRVTYPEASRLLLNCEALLADVEDVPAATALLGAANLFFDRSIERFKTAFDLARRLLEGIGHNLGAGNAKTFVFLMDMNEVFEKYVRAVLESHFDCAVKPQDHVGNLLRTEKAAMRQKADYLWRQSSQCWIGDAKYKHLAKVGSRALRFSDLEEPPHQENDANHLAGRVLSTDDVRQLTVYAELVGKRHQSAEPPSLMLLYPFVGPERACIADSVCTWNGSRFWLTPVLVRKQSSVADAIRFPPILEELTGCA